MINFIRPLFEELREFIHKYNFQDSEEEIDFFKYVKPLILSKLIYYNDIYILELRKPNGNKEVVKEHYKKKQAAIVDFCNSNLDFYQYYALRQHIWINTTFLGDMRTTSYAIIVAYWIKTHCFLPAAIIR